MFRGPVVEAMRNDYPEQFAAIGFTDKALVTLIYEVRHDDEGEFYHLVTLWKSTKRERAIYKKFTGS